MASGQGSAARIKAIPEPVTQVPGPASASIARGGRATGVVNPIGDPGSALLSAAELAGLRATVEASLPWQVIVLRKTETRDTAGDEAENWQRVASYRCDVEFATEQPERPVAGAMRAIGGYLITLPWYAVIRPEFRLQVNGVVYEIRNRDDNWTDQAAVYVIAERVE